MMPVDDTTSRPSDGQWVRLEFRTLVERVVASSRLLGYDVTLSPGLPIKLEGWSRALHKMVASAIEISLQQGARARIRLTSTSNQCELEINVTGKRLPPVRQLISRPPVPQDVEHSRLTQRMASELRNIRAVAQDHGGDIAIGKHDGVARRLTISLRTARP